MWDLGYIVHTLLKNKSEIKRHCVKMIQFPGIWFCNRAYLEAVTKNYYSNDPPNNAWFPQENFFLVNFASFGQEPKWLLLSRVTHDRGEHQYERCKHYSSFLLTREDKTLLDNIGFGSAVVENASILPPLESTYRMVQYLCQSFVDYYHDRCRFFLPKEPTLTLPQLYVNLVGLIVNQSYDDLICLTSDSVNDFTLVSKKCLQYAMTALKMPSHGEAYQIKNEEESKQIRDAYFKEPLNSFDKPKMPIQFFISDYLVGVNTTKIATAR